MISDYINRKAAGLITELERDDNKIKVKIKHFNEWSGEEDEIEEEHDLDALKREKAIREQQVKELHALIADAENLAA